MSGALTDDEQLLLVKLEGSERFVDLNSVAGDLSEVHELLDFCCRNAREPGEQAAMLTEACWSAAVMRYARCFKKGESWRIRLLDEFDKHADECDRSMHEYLDVLRDNIYAHQCGLGADRRLIALVNRKGIIGWSSAGTSVNFLGPDIAERTKQHVARVARWFNKAAEQERLRLEGVIARNPAALIVLGPFAPKHFVLDPADPEIKKRVAARTKSRARARQK